MTARGGRVRFGRYARQYLRRTFSLVARGKARRALSDAAIGEAAKQLIHLRYGFASMQVEETLQLCLQLGGVHRR
jgi:hypothetical protein